MSAAATNGRAAVRELPLPPQSLEAEEYVLGAMMLSPHAIDAVSEILDGSDFYRESHGKIYRAALDLHQRGEPVDAITVAANLERRDELNEVDGKERIQEIATLAPVAGNAAHHARIVREKAVDRSVIVAGARAQELGWDPTIDPSEKVDRVQEIAYGLTIARGDTAMLALGTPLKGVFDQMTRAAESGQDTVGVPSGFRDVDQLTTGFEPGALIILAGRPGMGKSSYAGAIAANVSVRRGLPVGVFSLEMSNAVMAQRLLAREARVELKKIRAPGRGLSQEEWSRLARAASILEQAPLHTSDRHSSIGAMRREVRRLKTRRPDLALVIVDYLQLIEEKAENRTQEITKISRALRRLAVDYDVPVLALSQLNRQVESRTDHRPQLADLRESGALEQDADVVMLLYREGYYNKSSPTPELTEVIVAKSRNGPTGVAQVHWDERYSTFREITHIPYGGQQ